VTAIAARIRVSQEKETMLGTLYGRALASQAPQSLLHDEHAERLVGLVDYDSKLGLNEMVATSVALRARQFDGWTTAFLTRHRDAVVVHLGCGLDSRVYRVDRLPTVS
jgi:O-methyltransferase involved in polyketide biosynthesis